MQAQLPRVWIRVAWLMGTVAALGINLAAVRALHALDDGLLIQVGLISLAAEYALFRAILGRGLARLYWAGFLAAVPVAIAFVAWCMGYYRVEIGMSWSRLVSGTLPRWARDEGTTRGKLVLGSLFATIVFLPQFVLASSVGGIARGLGQAFVGRSALAPSAAEASNRPRR